MSSAAIQLASLSVIFALSIACSSSPSRSDRGDPSSAAGAGDAHAGKSATSDPAGAGSSVGGLSGSAGDPGSLLAGSANAGSSGGSSAAGSSSGGSAASGGGGSFTLAWQDDFDTLDTNAWQAQTFSFDGNEAQFSPDNVSVANGVLTLSLTAAASGSAKPYLGVELRSSRTLTFGKVSARMRFARGSGVVSGLVLFYTPYPNCDWNEIDIEHLGKTSTQSQLNAMVFTGTQVPDCTTSVTPTADPQLVSLGFDAETDFHLYDVEWTPDAVKYFADGVLLRTWDANIAHLVRPETILLTIWASSAPSWAGPLDANSAPTTADVDWIKVYDYAG